MRVDLGCLLLLVVLAGVARAEPSPSPAPATQLIVWDGTEAELKERRKDWLEIRLHKPYPQSVAGKLALGACDDPRAVEVLRALLPGVSIQAILAPAACPHPARGYDWPTIETLKLGDLVLTVLVFAKKDVQPGDDDHDRVLALLRDRKGSLVDVNSDEGVAGHLDCSDSEIRRQGKALVVRSGCPNHRCPSAQQAVIAVEVRYAVEKGRLALKQSDSFSYKYCAGE
jgi:hypothetical protein